MLERADLMAAPHGWRECRPVILGIDQLPDPKMQPALDRVWAKLPDSDRILQHQFSCWNRHTPVHMAVAEKISTLLSQELASEVAD